MSQCCLQPSGNEAVCPATQLLSTCQSCQVCCLSKAREFLFFFIFTLTRASPSVAPHIGCRSLDRPKFWRFQVSQLIVRFYFRSHTTLLTFLKAVVWWKFKRVACCRHQCCADMEDVFTFFISVTITPPQCVNSPFKVNLTYININLPE